MDVITIEVTREDWDAATEAVKNIPAGEAYSALCPIAHALNRQRNGLKKWYMGMDMAYALPPEMHWFKARIGRDELETLYADDNGKFLRKLFDGAHNRAAVHPGLPVIIQFSYEPVAREVPPDW